jgi:hypothetical protein
VLVNLDYMFGADPSSVAFDNLNLFTKSAGIDDFSSEEEEEGNRGDKKPDLYEDETLSKQKDFTTEMPHLPQQPLRTLISGCNSGTILNPEGLTLQEGDHVAQEGRVFFYKSSAGKYPMAVWKNYSYAFTQIKRRGAHNRIIFRCTHTDICRGRIHVDSERKCVVKSLPHNYDTVPPDFDTFFCRMKHRIPIEPTIDTFLPTKKLKLTSETNFNSEIPLQTVVNPMPATLFQSRTEGFVTTSNNEVSS